MNVFFEIKIFGDYLEELWGALGQCLEEETRSSSHYKGSRKGDKRESACGMEEAQK